MLKAAGVGQLPFTLRESSGGARHRWSNGDSLGGHPKISAAKEKLALHLRTEGETYRAIREQTGLALSTIRRVIAEAEAKGVES